MSVTSWNANSKRKISVTKRFLQTKKNEYSQCDVKNAVNERLEGQLTINISHKYENMNIVLII